MTSEDWAVAEFNSMPHHTPPHRDIPSIIFAYIQHPPVTGEEPNWPQLFEYFNSRRASDGHNNLRDLYIFMTRVAIPRAVVQNRNHLLSLYLTRPNLTPRLRVRWDTWDFAPQAKRPTGIVDYNANNPYVNTRNLHLNQPRSIFRAIQTPDGNSFVQWLHSRMPAPEGRSTPVQMMHQVSELDKYLNDDELHVRNMLPTQLFNRTVRVFNIWWFLMRCNSLLRGYEQNNWLGIEAEQF
jgi:hypothetical protein